jgi:transposase InsO family protein
MVAVPSSLSLSSFDSTGPRRRSHPSQQPATPRANGKVERSHGIDAEELHRMLEGVVIDDTELFNDRLQEWEDFYNYNRPHGGLGGQTPMRG